MNKEALSKFRKLCAAMHVVAGDIQHGKREPSIRAFFSPSDLPKQPRNRSQTTRTKNIISAPVRPSSSSAPPPSSLKDILAKSVKTTTAKATESSSQATEDSVVKSSELKDNDSQSSVNSDSSEKGKGYARMKKQQEFNEKKFKKEKVDISSLFDSKNKNDNVAL